MVPQQRPWTSPANATSRPRASYSKTVASKAMNEHSPIADRLPTLKTEWSVMTVPVTGCRMPAGEPISPVREDPISTSVRTTELQSSHGPRRSDASHVPVSVRIDESGSVGDDRPHAIKERAAAAKMRANPQAPARGTTLAAVSLTE
jgi:hypothetical protein